MAAAMRSDDRPDAIELKVVPARAGDTGGDGEDKAPGALQRSLTFVDGFSYVIGALIGSGLFVVPGLVYNHVGVAGSIAIWTLGGLYSLAGSLVYSELATLLVSAGSEFTYLKAAFGEAISFCYVFLLFGVVGSGIFATICQICSRYLLSAFDLSSVDHDQMIQIVAILVVVAITALSLAGTKATSSVQRVLMVVKFVTVIAILVGAIVNQLWQPTLDLPSSSPTILAHRDPLANFRWANCVPAMVLVIFSFNGFQFLAPLSEEMVNPKRDIPRVFLSGISSVTLIGAFVFLAFFGVLSPQEILDNKDSLAVPFFRSVGGPILQRLMAVLIALCAVGSANSKLAGSTRIFFSAARDGLLPAAMANLTPQRRVPYVSIFLFSAWTISLIMIFGTNLAAAVSYSLVGQLIVFLLVGLSLLRLRWTMADVVRPYEVVLYPITPILFCLVSFFIVLYSLIDPVTFLTSCGSMGLCITGLPIYYFQKWLRTNRE